MIYGFKKMVSNLWFLVIRPNSKPASILTVKYEREMSHERFLHNPD